VSNHSLNTNIGARKVNLVDVGGGHTAACDRSHLLLLGAAAGSVLDAPAAGEGLAPDAVLAVRGRAHPIGSFVFGPAKGQCQVV